MHPKNIVIVGPTSSGKTDVATAIASFLNIPIINCDAIQIYNGLNTLSNKPHFIEQHRENGEVVSITQPHSIINFPAYSNFNFRIIRRKSDTLLVDKTLEPLEFFKWLIRVGFIPEIPEKSPVPVRNYLFDIRKPGESYSLAEFGTDIQRICIHEHIDEKILVGGTIYYAYHYLLGTSLETDGGETLKLKQKYDSFTVDELVELISQKDPEALPKLDIKNKARLAKAAAFIEQTGSKFSEQYVKKSEVNNDFLLIMIQPKSREEYVKKLDQIVEKRINSESLAEISELEMKYGTSILEWLSHVSYEYRHAVTISTMLKDTPELSLESPQVKAVIEELKAKERQYTKRQMTFMRKLEKDLLY